MSLSGMGMFDSKQIIIPAVGQRIPMVEGYIVIQDDARPELAVVLFEGRVVAHATLLTPKQAQHYGFMSDYPTKYGLVLKIDIGNDEWDVSLVSDDLSYVRALADACYAVDIAPLLRLSLENEVNEEGFTLDDDYVDNVITRLENHFPDTGLAFYPSDDFFSHESAEEPDDHMVAIVDTEVNRLIGYVEKAGVDEKYHDLYLTTGRKALVLALL